MTIVPGPAGQPTQSPATGKTREGRPSSAETSAARLRIAEIAALVGSTPNAVHARISQLRREGHNIPHLLGAGVFNVPVPDDVLGALDYEATARGVSHRVLAGRILTAVLTEGLVDAVLDDGG